jgi:hypothetical protein
MFVDVSPASLLSPAKHFILADTNSMASKSHKYDRNQRTA